MRGSDDGDSRSRPKTSSSSKPLVQRERSNVSSLQERKQQKDKVETARHFREIIRLARRSK
jgi:hypothetical protein